MGLTATRKFRFESKQYHSNSFYGISEWGKSNDFLEIFEANVSFLPLFRYFYAIISIFNVQVLQLAHLNLADNLMGKIPFVPLSHVKSLKSLDMSSNRIIKIEGKIIPHFINGNARL